MKPLASALAQVLGNRSMRHAEVAWFIAISAQWAYLVAVLVYAYDVGGVVATALVSTVRMLPAALAAPFTTMWADRFSPRLVLVAVHAGRAVAVGLIAIVIAAGLPTPLIFVAVALEGLIATLHRPTTMALMPALARTPQELVAANATTSTGEAVGVLLGPAIGGVLLTVGGVFLGTAGAVCGFALASALALGIAAVPHLGRRALEEKPASRLAELLAGFTALRTYPAAGIVVVLLGTQTFVRGIFTVLLVAASIELVGLGPSGVGYLNSAIGAGSLLGAFLSFSLVLRTRLAGPLLLGVAFWGIPIVLLGLAPATLLAFGFMGVLGVANSVEDVSGFSLIQRVVPNRLRARVFGAFETIVSLTVGVGSLVAPVLVGFLELNGALVAAGALLPIVALLAAPLVRRADTGAIVPQDQLELLRGVPMFAPLPLTVLEQVATGLVAEEHPVGSSVIRQGEPGNSWYLVAKGAADVIHDGEVINGLSRGDGFGEIALLSDRPRTATIVVRETLDVYRLPRDIFLEAVTGNQNAVLAGEAIVAERLATPGHPDH